MPVGLVGGLGTMELFLVLFFTAVLAAGLVGAGVVVLLVTRRRQGPPQNPGQR